MSVSLDQMQPMPGVIERIDWAVLGPHARRVRELGFDAGVVVEPVARGPFGRDPIAVRVGRMTVAIRRADAAAILVRPAT